MRILVTGAAGFIASNLIPRLLARGDEVAGADNFFLGKRQYVVQHPRFAFHELDLLDLDGVIAKRADMPYQSGNRHGMVKVKRLRTADCVVGGFRYASEGKVMGSLLLGL